MQSTSDLDYFHARDLRCSRVKSHDDPISDCRVDSARRFPLYIYIDGAPPLGGVNSAWVEGSRIFFSGGLLPVLGALVLM